MAAHYHMPGYICLSSVANERIDEICINHAEEKTGLLLAKEELVQEVDESKATLVAVKDQLGGVCDLARATADRLEQEAALLEAAAADRAALLEFVAQLQSKYQEKVEQLAATEAALVASEERLGFSEAGRAAAVQRAEEATTALAAERQQTAGLQQQLSEAAAELAAEREQTVRLQQQWEEEAAALAAERQQHDQLQQLLSEQLAEASAALATQRQDAEALAAGLQERLEADAAARAAAEQRADEAAAALASERQQSAGLRQQLAELRASHVAGAQQYAQLQQQLAATAAARGAEAQRAAWLQASLERTSWLLAEADAGCAAEAQRAAELQRRVKDLEEGDDIAFRAVNIVRAAVEADAARARAAFRGLALRKVMQQTIRQLRRELAESRRDAADQNEPGNESP